MATRADSFMNTTSKIRIGELIGAIIIFAVGAVAVLNSPPSPRTLAATKEYDAAATAVLEVCKNTPQDTCKENYERMHEECFDSKYAKLRQYLTICSDPRVIAVGSST